MVKSHSWDSGKAPAVTYFRAFLHLSNSNFVRYTFSRILHQIPRVFQVSQNSRVFQVLKICGHPILAGLLATHKGISYLTIHCTSQNHSWWNNATPSFQKLLKYASVKVVHNENGLVVVLNHMLKAGVRVCNLATKILQLVKSDTKHVWKPFVHRSCNHWLMQLMHVSQYNTHE